MAWLTTITLVLRGITTALWLVLRPTLGWLLVAIGVIGMPLPIINGTIFLVIGLVLLGPRNRALRWMRVQIKLLLRRWAALETPLIGPLGRLAHRSARQVSRGSRRLHWWWIERRAARRISAPQHHPLTGD